MSRLSKVGHYFQRIVNTPWTLGICLYMAVFLVVLMLFSTPPDLTPTLLLTVNLPTPTPPLLHSRTSPLLQYPIPGCGCRRSYRPENDVRHHGIRSTCGGYADLRGPRQNVISYSVYGNISEEFFGGIERNMKTLLQYYPEWIMRVYLDMDDQQPGLKQLICDLSCRYDDMDFCNVRSLPTVGDISGRVGSAWRFVPLGDESVDRFIVRDADSYLSQRGRDAVDAWIASNLTFHIIRDHPDHGAVMLAGLWGAWNRYNTVYRPVRDAMLQDTRSSRKTEDQRVLAKFLWPGILRRKDVISHDSYLCRRFPATSPFPSQRHHPYDIMGTRMSGRAKLHRPCPVECRPRDHKDWRYC